MNINDVIDFLQCPLKCKHSRGNVTQAPSLTTVYPLACWTAFDYYFRHLAEGKRIPESRLLSVFNNALSIIKLPTEFQERYKRNFIFFSKLYLKRITKFADRLYFKYPVSHVSDINTTIEGSIDALAIREGVDNYYELHFYRGINNYMYYESLRDLRLALSKLALISDTLFGVNTIDNTNIVIVDVTQEKILSLPLTSVKVDHFKSEAGKIAAAVELGMYYSRNDGNICTTCNYRKTCKSYLNVDAKPGRPIEYE